MEARTPVNYEPYSNPLQPNASWSREYIDNLPDSHFLVAPYGWIHYSAHTPSHVDSRGRSHPLSLRHLPIVDAQGRFDCAHLQNAAARANQTSVPVKIQREAKKLAMSLYEKNCRR